MGASQLSKDWPQLRMTRLWSRQPADSPSSACGWPGLPPASACCMSGTTEHTDQTQMGCLMNLSGRS